MNHYAMEAMYDRILDSLFLLERIWRPLPFLVLWVVCFRIVRLRNPQRCTNSTVNLHSCVKRLDGEMVFMLTNFSEMRWKLKKSCSMRQNKSQISLWLLLVPQSFNPFLQGCDDRVGRTSSGKNLHQTQGAKLYLLRHIRDLSCSTSSTYLLSPEYANLDDMHFIRDGLNLLSTFFLLDEMIDRGKLIHFLRVKEFHRFLPLRPLYPWWIKWMNPFNHHKNGWIMDFVRTLLIVQISFCLLIGSGS